MKHKGTVHRKMYILSSFTHTCSKLYEFLLLNIQEDIVKNVGKQTVAGPHIWKNTIQIHVWNTLRLSKG